MFKRLTAKFKAREAPVRPSLAAFGKHPGWDDHIDDLGMQTDLLVSVKRHLYTEGIAGNIDSGAWERLAEDQRLPGFDHVFIVRGGGDLAVGRLWSSSDGKGRTRFPMVVCADCSGHGTGWALSHALPLLDRVKHECEATTSRDEVIKSLDRARAELAGAAGDTTPEQPPDEHLLRTLGAHPEMGPDGTGVLRILYQIERESASYRRDAGRPRSVVIRPQNLRVPACAPGTADRAALWLAFLTAQLDDGAPVIVLIPFGQDWVDVIIGYPTPAQMFCIRASSRALPLTTEIPYSLDDQFVARARAAINV